MYWSKIDPTVIMAQSRNHPALSLTAYTQKYTYKYTLGDHEDMQAKDLNFLFIPPPPSTGGYSDSRVAELIFITCSLTRSLGPDFCQRVIWLPCPSDNRLPHAACKKSPPPFSGEIYEGGSVCGSLLPATSMIPFSSGGLLA